MVTPVRILGWRSGANFAVWGPGTSFSSAFALANCAGSAEFAKAPAKKPAKAGKKK